MLTTGGYRKYLGFFGKRNAGKSSLINRLVGQEISIVSEQPGTTTDPVYKSLEIHPIGPVTVIDTPGVDDAGELGELRVERAKRVLYKIDLAILVVDNNWNDYEEWLINSFKKMDIPFVIALNKSDLNHDHTDILKHVEKFPHLLVSAKTGEGIEKLRELIAKELPEEEEIPLLSDLVDGGEIVLLVVPIDLGAPKGRLIMPQVEAIRETLDREAICIVVKERELRWALEKLKAPPALVVADSHLISRIAADVPEEIPLTTFSILEARHKGDLFELVRGAKAIENLTSESKVVIMEACSHVPLVEDIGRVKIPRWLTNHVGGGIEFEIKSGKEFPEDLENVDMIVHCGGCTLTRAMMLRRLREAKRRGIPVSNYGVVISYLHGILDRVLNPFPEVRALLEEANKENQRT
ncbi:MAG: [FeFe] hydrogenase H-cluster maturation GTPase HydF [Kosmotoga sp.]|uniref:[FeFe] hydrogenase H-cluster maturation GTPase HydF n=1 Tax=Kosmotoga sp. TaxID=1955248 RepID=UPI0025C46F59|nr:[FeFe] hydrogenase H-cluster maturation GTPase HydF [Kosmotoga sp.]MCD6160496.1 [FeFe] hydrogenase H-cluster maturation GTPase HydF [Kosmotoga sp.]